MKKESKKVKKGGIFWTPRIIVIVLALFLAIFSFDVFESCNSFLSCLLGLFMHNLPSIFLLVILAISWKHEFFGAIIFLSLGVLSLLGLIAILLFAKAPGILKLNPVLIILSIITLIVGFLFLKDKRRTK